MNQARGKDEPSTLLEAKRLLQSLLEERKKHLRSVKIIELRIKELSKQFKMNITFDDNSFSVEEDGERKARR